MEGDHVGAVAGGGVGVFVAFHEDGGDADGEGGAGEDWGEFALAAGGCALAAGLLDGVGGVEDDGVAGSGHDGEAAEVGDEGVVAEACAAFGEEDAFVAGFGDFCGDVLHVPGGEELAFLDVDGAAGFAGGDEEVGLAAEEGGDLEDVDGFGGRVALGGVVDVGEDGDAEAFADGGEDGEALMQADASGGLGAGAVGFVEAGFVDEGDVGEAADLGEGVGHFEGVGFGFDLAGAGDEDEGSVVGDDDVAHADLAGAGGGLVVLFVGGGEGGGEGGGVRQGGTALRLRR